MDAAKAGGVDRERGHLVGRGGHRSGDRCLDRPFRNRYFGGPHVGRRRGWLTIGSGTGGSGLGALVLGVLVLGALGLGRDGPGQRCHRLHRRLRQAAHLVGQPTLENARLGPQACLACRFLRGRRGRRGRRWCAGGDEVGPFGRESACRFCSRCGVCTQHGRGGLHRRAERRRGDISGRRHAPLGTRLAGGHRHVGFGHRLRTAGHTGAGRRLRRGCRGLRLRLPLGSGLAD